MVYSLQVRLTVSFVLLIVLITGLTYVYTYNEARNALKDTIKEELVIVSDMAASQFDAEKTANLVNFKVGDDNTSQYMEIVEMTYSFRENNEDINEFYIMRMEGEKVIFIADDWAVKGPEAPSLIGDEYADYDPMLLEAFRGQTVATDIYTDEWGTYMSGFAPIKDESGAVVAVVALDMTVNTVQAKIDFIGSLIYYVMGAAVIIAGLLVLFFSVTIVKDIKKLTAVANKMSNGDLTFQLPEIKSKNEIYELNEGLKSVVAAMEFLKENAEANKPEDAKKTQKQKKGE